MPIYRVHFWLDGQHYGPFDLEAPDATAGLTEAIMEAAASGVAFDGYYEHTIAEQDAEGYWRLLE